MAAKSKKRLSKNENKLLKLNNLELKDVICSICQSILVEPVTLPCFHYFCLRCFNGSIENNALCCPLCRLRIGSWLRTATKQKNLVNNELWNFIKSRFSQAIDIKAKGDDIILPEESLLRRLSAPGEIKSEYEAEINRLRAERLRLEQKHLIETESLIRKIQEEEEKAHKNHLEALKQDEILAVQMQNNDLKTASQTVQRKRNQRGTTLKPRLKATKIDGFLTKSHVLDLQKSPLLTDDNTTSTESSTPKISTGKLSNHASPEMVPTYGKLIRSFIDKKVKNGPGLWNKENGESLKEKDVAASKVTDSEDKNIKHKHVIQSLLVSLPLSCTGILQHKSNVVENKNMETDSVDSMRQELCFFKPIQGATPTSFNTSKRLPLRVPGVRADPEATTESTQHGDAPSRGQYLDGLCRLRNGSLARNLPSAFVIALNMLRVKKEHPAKCANTKSKRKKRTSTSPLVTATLPVKRNSTKKQTLVDGISKLKSGNNLRRTRSMGSLTKEENETTPKKAKHDRKVCSERKPYLRSDSKRSNTKKESNSPPVIAEALNNNKVNLVVKNLSSPLKNCDVKKILQEQLRIENLIEQEKSDYELARKMEAEWNGRRQPRRAAIKRQITLNYALRPAKKLKV